MNIWVSNYNALVINIDGISNKQTWKRIKRTYPDIKDILIISNVLSVKEILYAVSSIRKICRKNILIDARTQNPNISMLDQIRNSKIGIIPPENIIFIGNGDIDRNISFDLSAKYCDINDFIE